MLESIIWNAHASLPSGLYRRRFRQRRALSTFLMHFHAFSHIFRCFSLLVAFWGFSPHLPSLHAARFPSMMCMLPFHSLADSLLHDYFLFRLRRYISFPNSEDISGFSQHRCSSLPHACFSAREKEASLHGTRHFLSFLCVRVFPFSVHHHAWFVLVSGRDSRRLTRGHISDIAILPWVY